jgi:hypothetical protein
MRMDQEAQGVECIQEALKLHCNKEFEQLLAVAQKALMEKSSPVEQKVRACCLFSRYWSSAKHVCMYTSLSSYSRLLFLVSARDNAHARVNPYACVNAHRCVSRFNMKITEIAFTPFYS